jgi:hypothetical protein
MVEGRRLHNAWKRVTRDLVRLPDRSSDFDTSRVVIHNACEPAQVLVILADAPAPYTAKARTATNFRSRSHQPAVLLACRAQLLLQFVNVPDKFLIGCAQVDWRVALPLAPENPIN